MIDVWLVGWMVVFVGWTNVWTDGRVGGSIGLRIWYRGPTSYAVGQHLRNIS